MPKPELKHPPENRLKTYSQDDSLIFFLRHGQICSAEEKRFIGTTDVDLDDTDLLQARYWQTVFSEVSLPCLNLPLKNLFQIKPAYGELFVLG